MNFLDFLILANNFGRTAAPQAAAVDASAVGEPELSVGVAAADEIYADDSEDDIELL